MTAKSDPEEDPKAEGPPDHRQSDWDFFLEHLKTKDFQIESYFDRTTTWKDNVAVQLRVSHIYDLSHFWVVSETNELDLLHKYLYVFYLQHGEHYKVPQEHFKLNMYCVTYIEKAYYRSILVSIPQEMGMTSLAFVFLIDFGFVGRVELDQIYFMTKRLYGVPQFSIRACLSGLGPVGTQTWSAQALDRFGELVCEKAVYAQVTHKNDKKRIVFLRIGDYDFKTNSYIYINDMLVSEGLAKMLNVMDIRDMKHAHAKKNRSGSRKARLPFLSPSFVDIEKGKSVDSVAATRKICDFTI